MNVIGMQGIVGGSGFTFSDSPSTSSSSQFQFNNGGGTSTKRPLASCREDLEMERRRGWKTLRGPSSSSSTTSSSMNLRHNGNGTSGIIEESDDDIVVHGRNKRRRTGLASSSIIDDTQADVAGAPDANTNTVNQEGFCKDVRISISLVNSASNDGTSSPPAAAATARNINSPPIKAGWYTAILSANGHRHRHGTTKHDDGTSYTEPYQKKDYARQSEYEHEQYRARPLATQIEQQQQRLIHASQQTKHSRAMVRSLSEKDDLLATRIRIEQQQQSLIYASQQTEHSRAMLKSLGIGFDISCGEELAS